MGARAKRESIHAFAVRARRAAAGNMTAARRYLGLAAFARSNGERGYAAELLSRAGEARRSCAMNRSSITRRLGWEAR